MGTGSLERTDLFDEVSAAAPFIGRTLGPGIGLEVRDLATGEQLLTLSDVAGIVSLGFSRQPPTGSSCPTSEGGIGIGVRNGELRPRRPGHRVARIFHRSRIRAGRSVSPDGSHLVVSQGSEFDKISGIVVDAPTLVVYDTATGNELAPT